MEHWKTDQQKPKAATYLTFLVFMAEMVAVAEAVGNRRVW